MNQFQMFMPKTQPINPPSLFKLENEKCLFSIIGAGTIRSNSKYKVVLVLHRAKNACAFKITLRGTLYEDSETIELQPNSLKILEFDVPQLRTGYHELKVEGLTGVSYKNLHELNVLEEKPIILIQTDKATYKPGDLVQFRVLFLNDRTCPYAFEDMEQEITFVISDGENNRLKQWKDIKLTKGIYTGKYQLSEEPVLGRWKIDIISKGQSLETKFFEVDKYVLPKFNVTIETAKHVVISHGTINITVRSKYTYGKNVKGKCIVTLKTNVFGFGVNPVSALKTIDIDGKGEAEFKLVDDLNLQLNNVNQTQLDVRVVVEEELTGNKQEAKETIHLYLKPYKLQYVDPKSEYEADKPYVIKVAVKNVDDTPVIDVKNPVKLVITKPTMTGLQFLTNFCQPVCEDLKIAELNANLNEQGIATFQCTFSENTSILMMHASYLECKASVHHIRRHIKTLEDKDLLKVTILTESPRLGEKFEILIESCEVIKYFVYTIVGRGKILKTELINLAADTKAYTLEVVPTFDMIPSAVIFVHFVVNNKFQFVEQNIFMKREFHNKICVNAPTEVKPSEDILLEVETASNSYVGLLGVDQSVLLLRAGNDLQQHQVFEKLNYFKTRTNKKDGYNSETYPGEVSGLIMLGNVWAPMPQSRPDPCFIEGGGLFGGTRVVTAFGCSSASSQQQSMSVFGRQTIQMQQQQQQQQPLPVIAPIVKVRKEFPENWLFEDIECTNNGITRLKRKIPDTITSWVITGFSLNPETGLAITKNPTIIKTFRPFFISTNLPYSIKRDEIISIPVLIFNYMDHDLDAEITFDNTDNEFVFMEPGDDQLKRIKSLKVTANSGGNVYFKICPKIIGHLTLKITALSPLAGDAIHKKLKVEAEGLTIFKNHDYILNAESDSLVDTERSVKLEIPTYIVQGSELIEVSLMGNILGSTITNLDKLVRMPYGCGEQNMVNFVPNILVLWYLESVDELSENIESKAKKFLEIGYQRELTYKHNNGSFSAFGKSDKSGSTWLTAYVVRSFHQAKKYIDVSNKLLEEGLDFLEKTQTSSGSFKEVGCVIDFEHMNELGLTAFVLLAFIENEEFYEKHETVIKCGLKYLQENVLISKDLYALSISLYILHKYKLPIAHELLAKLEILSHTNAGLKWWSKDVKATTTKKFLHSKSHDVEITGYILMALLDMNLPVMPIIKWLISQRNTNGGFASTQETVVGLWALIKFAEKCGAGEPKINLEVNSGIESSPRKFHVNVDNALVVQKAELPKQTREIIFRAQGRGTAIFQIAYRYNILDEQVKKSFKLRATVTVMQKMSLKIFAEFIPHMGEQFSNMVVMEINLPSGYIALTDCFDKIRDVEGVKRIETKHENTVIIIYFERLHAAKTKCITTEAELSHEVSGQKPTAITIYDYYDNQRCAVEFYQI